MIYSLRGAELKDTDSIVRDASASQNDATIVDTGLTLTSCNEAGLGNITSKTAVVLNATGGETVNIGNYTIAECVITSSATSEYNNSIVNITYGYTFVGDAYNVIANTTSGIAKVTEWFDIFVVIGAMVVLILLTVIIITAIRGSGLMGEGSAQGGGTIGSA